MYLIYALFAALILTTTIHANTCWPKRCCIDKGKVRDFFFPEDCEPRPGEACCPTKNCVSEYFDSYIGTGYRQDKFDFSTASDSNATIHTARKIRWKDLKILPAYCYSEYRNNCGFIVKMYGDYGRIYDGKAKNKEWIADNTLSFSEKACAGRGEVWDIGGGLGYNLSFCDENLTFAPFIGYDHNELHYQMFDVERLFGPFQGLLTNQHHSYRNLWRGPWVGFEFKSGPWFCNSLWMRLGYDWHYMLFRGRLKDTLPVPTTPITIRCERRQKAHGHGNHVWFGFDYFCVKRWSIGFYFDYKGYKAKTGTQISKCNDSTLNRKVQFNGGNWHSYNILITLGYHWP